MSEALPSEHRPRTLVALGLAVSLVAVEGARAQRRLTGPAPTGTRVLTGTFTPDGDWFLFTQDPSTATGFALYSVAVDGSDAAQLLSGPADADEAVQLFVPSPDSRWVVFEDPTSTIFPGETGFARPLKVGPVGGPAFFEREIRAYGEPIFVADGDRLLYVRDLGGGDADLVSAASDNPVADVRVLSAPLLGARVRQLAVDEARARALYSVLPTAGSGPGELWATPVDDGAPLRIDDALPTGALLGISPDGASAVWSHGGSIWASSTTAPGRRQLFSLEAGSTDQIRRWTISPSSTFLVAAIESTSGVVTHLIGIRLDGSSPAVPLVVTTEVHTHAFTPDGAWLVSCIDSSGTRELWAIPTVGSSPSVRLDAGAPPSLSVVCGSERLTSDSKRVVFVVAAADRSVAYSAALDGSSLVRLSQNRARAQILQLALTLNGRFLVLEVDEVIGTPPLEVVSTFAFRVSPAGPPSTRRLLFSPSDDHFAPFVIAPSGATVIVRGRFGGVDEELREVPLSGPPDPGTTLADGGLHLPGGSLGGFVADPTSRSVVFEVKQHDAAAEDLWSATLPRVFGDDFESGDLSGWSR